MLNPSIARWNGVDALAEGYLPISPFVYVANNPLKFIDPNGEYILLHLNRDERDADPIYGYYFEGKIYRYDGTHDFENAEEIDISDNSFLQDVVAAFDYLVENGGEEAGDLISEFSTSLEKNAYLLEGEGLTDFAASGNYINWHSTSGLLVENENGEIIGAQTPALGLLHELGHVNIRFQERANGGAIYPNKQEEEQAIINNYETPFANGVDQETARSRHNGGIAYPTTGPTTTDPNIQRAGEIHPESTREKALQFMRQIRN